MRFSIGKALAFSMLASFCLGIVACGSEKAPKSPTLATSDEDAGEEEDEEAEAKPKKATKKTETKPELSISKDSCPTGVTPCPAAATVPATGVGSGTVTTTPGPTIATATGTGTTVSAPWMPTTEKSKAEKSNQGPLSGLCWLPILPDFIKQSVCSGTK